MNALWIKVSLPVAACFLCFAAMGADPAEPLPPTSGVAAESSSAADASTPGSTEGGANATAATPAESEHGGASDEGKAGDPESSDAADETKPAGEQPAANEGEAGTPANTDREPAPFAPTPPEIMGAPVSDTGPVATANSASGVSGPQPSKVTTGPGAAVAPAPTDDLRFNFSDVPVDKVLDYLSQAAGFIVVQEAKVDGRVSVISHQPLNRDEAVDLLNTVLNEKGFAAIRNDRTLTIVKREEAGKRNIPVQTGNVPELIPKTDEMITQIIAVRHTDATQLLENLTPLLPTYAVASANKSSNAIVLTDIQANVRRMAEIIHALDTSISDISEIRVFTLTYSKASDTAKLLNALFQPPAAPGQNANPNQIRQFFQRMRGGGPPASDTPPESEAKQAAARVQAVADDRTNAVVVAAPGEMMPLIEQVITEIDKVSTPATEIRVFALKFGDATDMAQVINDTFAPTNAASATNNQGPQRFVRGRAGGDGGGQAQQPAVNAAVNAVADTRTNSIVVAAEGALMEQIAAMVEQLDSNPARDQKVYIYKIKNADPGQVAAITQGMFSQQSGTASRSTQSNARTNPNTTRSNTTSRNSSGLGTSSMRSSGR